MKKEFSNRRDFLVKSSLLFGGIFAMSAVPRYNYANENKKGTQKSRWPYKILNPLEASKLGYEGYYKGECCYGAVFGMINTLNKLFPKEYLNFPMEMFYYGRGGAAGWGTLCGALNGGSAIITLIAGNDYLPLVNELIGWYTLEPFPSKDHDRYAKFKNQVQSISNSPLCHISVTKWCKAANIKEGSKERSDRCAKVTGDVVKKAVMILNDWHEKKFVSTYKADKSFADCISCHVDRSGVLNNSKGTMNCVQCHERHEI